jgi:hypothetical protein
VTTTTHVAVGSSNFIVVVHACHGLRDSNPHQSAKRTQSRGPYAAPVFYGRLFCQRLDRLLPTP